MSHKHGVGNACFWSYDGSKISCNSWRNYHVKSHGCYRTVFIYFLGFATDITGQYTCYSKCSKWPPLDSKEVCAPRRIVWRTRWKIRPFRAFAIASVLSCYVRGKTEEINKHSFVTPMRFDVIISPDIAGKLRTVVTPEASVFDLMFMGHFLLV